MEQAEDGISYLADTLGDYLDAEIVQNMKEIASAVNATKTASFELVFDPTLVRGMSYYTGTIFEIAIPEFISRISFFKQICRLLRLLRNLKSVFHQKQDDTLKSDGKSAGRNIFSGEVSNHLVVTSCF